MFQKGDARFLQEVLDFDGYFFDLDGTVFLGEKLLPGVLETLSVLRRKGKKILFLSNTTTRTRDDCRVRLQKLGLEAQCDEIVTAGFASAVYLNEGEVKPRVFVVGEPALNSELAEQGVEQTADPLKATHVLVGMDMHFSYDKLHQAMKAVRSGAALIAANPDPNCPVDGDLIPDTWSMVKAIEAASCVAPLIVIGKPSTYYGAKVLEWCGLPGDRCLMVGDRLETDILFGIANGMRTALVLTGATTETEIKQSAIRPDYVWNSLEQFLSIVQAS